MERTVEEHVAKCVNGLAKLAVKKSANSACIWIAHQPKYPEAANRFNK